jgi:hypothetical protein
VVTTVRESPYIDPLTGQSRTIREPVYGQEMSYFHETIELLMNGDSLLEWKRSVREEQIRH